MTPKPTTAVATTSRMAQVDLTQALVVKSKDGVIKQIRTKVKLSTKDGTLVKMGTMKQTDEQGNKSALFVISAQGFIELGAKCGVVAVPTPTITVNGEVQPNPYPDPVTGKVYARAVALGYTALGQFVPSARTIIYDANLENIQDWIAKAKWPDNAKWFKMWPLRKDDKGQFVPPSGCGEEWAPYQIDSSMVLWVNCMCPSVTAWQGEMRNRASKAIRTAETFAARNAIANHPGIIRQRKFSENEATVDCIAWYAAEGAMRFGKDMLTIDPMKIIEMESQRTGKEIVVDDATVDLNETTSLEEIAAADADETDVHNEDEDDERDPLPLEDVLPTPDAPAAPAAKKAEPVAAPEADAERATLIQVVGALEKKIGAKGPIRRARIAVGMNDASDLDTADIEKLKALVEYHRQNKA